MAAVGSDMTAARRAAWCWALLLGLPLTTGENDAGLQEGSWPISLLSARRLRYRPLVGPVSSCR